MNLSENEIKILQEQIKKLQEQIKNLEINIRKNNNEIIRLKENRIKYIQSSSY